MNTVTTTTDTDDPTTTCNVTVIRSNVHSEPNRRDLRAGGTVAQFDVTTLVRADGRATIVSVPIA